MKKLLLITVLVLNVCTGAHVQAAQHNSLTDEEKSQGWELLFDGKTTAGWRNYGKPTMAGWKVVDGVLHNSGGHSGDGGDIVTEKQYQNFELYIEWKIASESNSGIFFHVNEGGGNAVYTTGPEYQLLDDKGWPDKLKPSQYSGANYGMAAPNNAVVKPLDEFNITRIIVDGDHVEHWLNGVKVVEYILWDRQWRRDVKKSKWKGVPNYGQYKTGHIGLQDHGGLTIFRNIKIRRL